MTLPRLPALAVVTALALLSACANAGPATGSSLSMTEHQSIAIAPGAVLTYDGADDSRCPPDVQCVVAGTVAYRFTLQTGATREPFTLTPAAPAHAPAALQGRQIVLADATPPPRKQPAATAVNIRIVTP